MTDLLREIRPVVPPPFEPRFETPPGQQAQVDFAQFQTESTDEPGVIASSGCSRWCSGTAGWCGAASCCIRICRRHCCHIAAFEALGGVSLQILYNRMKTTVIGDAVEGGHIFMAH